MNKGLLAFLLPIASLGACSAVTSSPIGYFEDANFAPLSRTEDITYSFSFMPSCTFGGRVEVTLQNPLLVDKEILYKPGTLTVFTEGKSSVHQFKVTSDMVSANDNTLTFTVTAITGKYSGEVVKKAITLPCGEPIIGKNPSSNTTLTGVDCYFGFRNGELVKGHGYYTIGAHDTDIYDPSLNRLTPSILSLTYKNTLYMPSFSGKSYLDIRSCVDQFDIGTFLPLLSNPFRRVTGRIRRMSVASLNRLTFELGNKYAVSRLNLSMKPLSEKTENDFESPYLFFPVGRGPLDSVYKIRIMMNELFDTNDSIYIDVKVHRTSWNFGPTFYSDYSVGIGEGEHV